MAHEAFNADYWIAIAAAAPVLALANTVTLTNWSRTYLEYHEARAAWEAELTGERRPLPLHRASRGRWLAYGNFGLQVVVTFFALVSLQNRAASVPPWVTTVGILLSLGMVARFAHVVGKLRSETYLLTVKRAAIPALEPDTDKGD
jgi:hypothetical protein